MHIGWGQQPRGFVSIIDTPPKELENFELLKSLETTGNFWCVTDPSTKLYGRICFKAGHSIKLFLDGTFGPNLDRVRGINLGIIHGQLFNGARCSIFKAYGHVEVGEPGSDQANNMKTLKKRLETPRFSGLKGHF